MDRETALREFQSVTADRRESYRMQIALCLAKHKEELEEVIHEASRKLGQQMKALKKEYVSFLYGSVLKSDVIQNKYRFYFHAMTLQWYLDDEPAEAYVDADTILRPFVELRENLTDEVKKYNGKVNQYDIWKLLFEELSYLDAVIAGILRYQLQDWERKEIFSDLTLSPYWIFKWGEYRGQTQFVLATDRVPKEKGIWEEEIRKAKQDKEALVFSYWYQGEYEKSRLHKLDMRFSVFEQCRLTGICLEQCNMEGCRFPDSRISCASFEGSNLTGADFTRCEREQVSFTGTELTGTKFRSEQVPFLNLTPDQLQDAILVREETA